MVWWISFMTLKLQLEFGSEIAMLQWIADNKRCKHCNIIPKDFGITLTDDNAVTYELAPAAEKPTPILRLVKL